MKFFLKLCPLAAFALLFMGFPARARAQITVSWGTESEGRYLANAAGTLLPVGSLVLLGSFAAGTDFAGNYSDYSYLTSRFTLLGTATIGSGGFTGVAGAFAASTVVGPSNVALSYWAFDSAAAGTATQWGIFSNTAGLWVTPSPVPNSLNTDVVDANVAYIGSLTPSLARTALLTTAPPAGVPDAPSLLIEIMALGTVVWLRRRCFRAAPPT